MLDDPDLLGNDVQLFAGLDADLDQGRAIMRAVPFRFRQFMANDLPGQGRVQGLAATLLALMTSHLDAFLRVIFLGGWRVRRRCQGFGFVEEHVPLVGAAGLALRHEQLALVRFQFLLQQVALGLEDTDLTHQSVTLTTEPIALTAKSIQLATQGVALGQERLELFGGDRHVRHHYL